MDWESKFSNIVKDTESNLEKVKVCLLFLRTLS